MSDRAPNARLMRRLGLVEGTREGLAITRRKRGEGWSFIGPSGKPIAAKAVIDRLNVRYGPEAGEEVIAQVDRYTTLRVLGSAPGWLYVEVEGEDVRGWVMERYVTTGSALG